MNPAQYSPSYTEPMPSPEQDYGTDIRSTCRFSATRCRPCFQA